MCLIAINVDNNNKIWIPLVVVYNSNKYVNLNTVVGGVCTV